jgi:hypothetical protein
MPSRPLKGRVRAGPGTGPRCEDGPETKTAQSQAGDKT